LIGGAGADSIQGNAGIDTADYRTSATAVDVDLTRSVQIGGDAAGDILQGIENVIGTYNDDILIGDAGANTISAFAGSDNVQGGAGNDFVIGGAGDDSVRGQAGNDRVFGDDGQDTLFGNDGNDILEGRNGNDFIKGDSGNDFLIGGDGVDSLIGGSGNDVFIFRRDNDNDFIGDFNGGAGAGDVIRLDGYGADFDSFAEVLTASSQVGTRVVIDLGSDDTITLLNTNLVTLDADDFLFV